jgi:hypothetical protein
MRKVRRRQKKKGRCVSMRYPVVDDREVLILWSNFCGIMPMGDTTEDRWAFGERPLNRVKKAQCQSWHHSAVGFPLVP